VGKVYRDKKSSGCALCKPHKHGWSPKKKPKEMALAREMEREVARARRQGADAGGEWIRSLRTKRMKLSQDAFARLLQVSVSTVSKWERGKAKPDAHLDARLRRIEHVARQAEQGLPGQRFAKWLEAPNRSLKGLAPIDLLGSDYGAQALDGFIEQMLHGVPV
jgi:DNA-binding transcriptional regulator YiaG